MKKKYLTLPLVALLFFSVTAFAQDSNDSKDAKDHRESEEASSTTTNPATNVQSVKLKKKWTLPKVMAPAASSAAANCADNLGAGGASYTACEAGKKDR